MHNTRQELDDVVIIITLLKMENKRRPTKMEDKRKRKPLSDCINTTTAIPTPVSYSNKNPSIDSATKYIPNDLNGKSVISSNTKTGSTDTDTSVSNGEVSFENPSSVAVASKPTKSSRVSVTLGRHEVMEPCSGYGRRRRGKELAIPVAGSPAARIKTAGAGVKLLEDRDTVQDKSCTMHHKKKRKDDKGSIKDIIEEQKAYFKEVDKFELVEEEVDSVDQLE